MNISDLINIEKKKEVKENERFKLYYEQLDDAQKEHVEAFIEDIKNVFMPSITSFGTALNEMTHEQREEFKANLEKLNT